jgi:hypothetical protein
LLAAEAVTIVPDIYWRLQNFVATRGSCTEENRKYMPPEPVEAEDEAIGEAVGGPKTKNGAVRSYLTSTITPALLRGLMELDKEERDRPVLWLAQFLESYDPSGV